MALNIQFIKYLNKLINEEVVIPHLVGQQTLDYNKLCDYLADGSTVTATDVSAVMKQIEKKIPFLLALNTKVVCSPEGLTFRPSVSGSITQSQLKAKLEARKAAEQDAEKAAKIDVNRKLALSDLTVNDLTASIAIDLPKKWMERFDADVEYKRMATDSADTGTTPSGDDGGSSDDSGNGGNSSTSNTGGDDNTGDQLP